MENSFQNLSIQSSAPPPTRTLASNVYRVKTEASCVVYKYDVKVQRKILNDGKPKLVTIKSNGPDAFRIIRARLTKAALLPISKFDRYSEKTLLYDGHDSLYANGLLTDSILTEEIAITSLNISDEDRKIIARDATSILITISPSSENRKMCDIPKLVNESDEEKAVNLIKFYSTLAKSHAPENYICLRGGRLFDPEKFKALPKTGMMRAKGIKMGTKLIGKDQLSVSIDIDSKEGTFFKDQPLMRSIADHFKCSEKELRDEFGNTKLMWKMEKYIRDMVVREDDTYRVFTISGLKWGEDEENRKFLKELSQICPEKVARYGRVPVVFEEILNDKKQSTFKYYPLNSLHVLPYSKVPLAKQDKENRPPALPPADRYNLINNARKDIRIDHQNEKLLAFQTQIENVPVYPKSEILAAPSIFGMKNGDMNRVNVDITKHSYNSNAHRFVEPARISSFTVFCDKNEMKDASKVEQFCNSLLRVCELKGMSGPSVNYRGVWQEELKQELKFIASKREEEKRNGNSPITFVLCFGFKESHDFLKYVEHECKVICQHVMMKTVDKIVKKKGNSILTDFTLHNIVKKINEKCGGTNLAVMGPMECKSLFPLKDNSQSPASLIIGMDVCHGDPLSMHQRMRGFIPDPSIIGIASNALTKNLQKFTGDFIATEGRQEQVSSDVMSDHGRYFVRKFFENHGRLPENVILVRDGVARSQYKYALDEFDSLMDGVREGVQTLAPQQSSTFRPREVLIITTKEHNLRLFDKVDGKVCNPRPGTVVDRDIVSPFHPEFFMIPHDAFSGTAKGVLVTILKDGEKDLKKYSQESLNEMKYFLHTMAFLHGISDLPPSLPEAVSVAHDLAERGSNIAKEMRYAHPEYRPSVEQLNEILPTRGTEFEGVKFTA